MILEAQPDIEVVAEAADGEAAVAVERRHRPDVVLMDVRMPGLDGLEATRRIVSRHDRRPAVGPAPRMIVLTTFDPDEYVYGALQAGAAGSCSRTSRRSISSAPSGRWSPATRCSHRRSRAASSSASRSPSARARRGGSRDLTARETEVFGWSRAA